jgi:hypothetical protein
MALEDAQHRHWITEKELCYDGYTNNDNMKPTIWRFRSKRNRWGPIGRGPIRGIGVSPVIDWPFFAMRQSEKCNSSQTFTNHHQQQQHYYD